mmetsp:Transcript_54491/g.117975  ORF Transcript_54491/g.117975 Transcript_54491/m.117975 type:complete len:220 (+) Transcript_54491:45-704(+)|eukprot:CAMPEP_0170621012 /NCGR_PEP_ID=MMETSP0224-20130122/28373_1 /TAXON_ID=285029 /ORGANISM="Togula jolla, Strain CCCM 725" /LENGTH=219 /DNA_ID=CAMNT_0010947241 /DNA_START=33 /DNA_END=692 /DNA_ORIENTATION=+
MEGPTQMAVDSQEKPASWVNFGGGPLTLDLPVGEGTGFTGLAPLQSPTPMAMSPWADSTACDSPWSPPWSPASPAMAVGRGGQSRSIPSSPVMWQTPVPVRHRQSPVAPRTFQLSPAPSPTGFAQALSPGAEIRRNATSLGIPLHLQLRPGEAGAPVPVRGATGHVVMPSPVARGGAPPQPPIFPDYRVSGHPQQPPELIRHIVTPLSGSRPRRAKGGA